MTVKPASPYFLIRIPRVAQQERKNSIGSILLPAKVFMTRNMQSGEIVDIGDGAASYFPEAKIGDTLLIHHFCEDSSENAAKQGNLIHQTESDNYYLVTGYELPGKRCETYGVWDGEKIIAHPDSIFLEAPKPVENDLPPEEFINQQTEVKNGLIVFKQWKENRDDIAARMKILKQEAQSLSKGTITEPIKKAIQEKEAELKQLSKKLNAQKLEDFTVVALHPAYNEMIQDSFGSLLYPGDKVVMLNIACQTTIEFMNQEYIVAPVKYCHGPSHWYQKAVKEFKSNTELV